MALGSLGSPAAGAQAAFGIQSLTATPYNADHTIDLRAGSHPFEYNLRFVMNQDAEGTPEGTLRDLIADLPAGMIGDPQALPRCSGADFEGAVPHCPGDTQIGIARVSVASIPETATVPVYNLTPPQGVAGSIGLSIVEFNSFQEASLRPSDYGIQVSDITIPTELEIQSVSVTIWGVPMEASHDAQRKCFTASGAVEGCESEVAPEAFFTLPTSCGEPLKTTVSVDSVQEPGRFVSTTVSSLGEGGLPAGLHGCDRPPFEPTITSQTQSPAADSPTGLDFDLRLPQQALPKGGDPTGAATATAALEDAVVSLPAGLAVNPSAAAGLEACSLAQIGYDEEESKAQGRPVFSGDPAAACPAGSEVGSVEVKTPLLDHPVPGVVYLARQIANPFGSLLAIYIVLDDPVSGVIVKLAGEVQPDPVSGQLRTVVRQNPQLPFEELSFHFTGGPRATFTTPPICGTYTTETELVPWSAPEGPTRHPSDAFAVTQGAGGASCASSEDQLPNSPSFEAGTAAPLAGSYAPFVLKLRREDGTQRLGALNLTLPPGLTGKLAGTAECSDTQIAQAASRSHEGEGALEQSSPSCPADSEIGTVTVGAGSGTPFYVQGRAYLAGPYKGAPLSMAIITPAVAGPFDLGVVVVRAALYVNESTAQITVKSDPIPTILHGIPLDVRSVAVQISKSDFTLNPTNCEAKAVAAEAISTTGQVAYLQNRFQVGGCGGLKFEPKLSIQLKGATKRTGHPALKAVVTYPKEGQYANIASAQVNLPASEFIDQGNLNKTCTRPVLAEGACPASTVYGHVEAWTPLLKQPLQGNVYLVGGYGYKLPALVAELNGQIKVLLVGKVDTGPNHGIRNTFETVPDAPVEKFVLQMKGGPKYSLLENSEPLCKKTQKAIVRFTSQNGKVDHFEPVVGNDCKKKSKKQAGHSRVKKGSARRALALLHRVGW
ncbi:MAG TPA: hypothetical protein VMH33_02720 [Solirubrobacterales bacterium]|nr:hypothetical protein [Solirubrobacterales bacterium]